VRYYNVEATNVDAKLKGAGRVPGRILVILGGKDKGSDYTGLPEAASERAILATVEWSVADKMNMQIAGSVAIERAGSLETGGGGCVMCGAGVARGCCWAPACAEF